MQQLSQADNLHPPPRLQGLSRTQGQGRAVHPRVKRRPRPVLYPAHGHRRAHHPRVLVHAMRLLPRLDDRARARGPRALEGGTLFIGAGPPAGGGRAPSPPATVAAAAQAHRHQQGGGTDGTGPPPHRHGPARRAGAATWPAQPHAQHALARAHTVAGVLSPRHAVTHFVPSFAIYSRPCCLRCHPKLQVLPHYA